MLVRYRTNLLIILMPPTTNLTNLINLLMLTMLTIQPAKAVDDKGCHPPPNPLFFNIVQRGGGGRGVKPKLKKYV